MNTVDPYHKPEQLDEYMAEDFNKITMAVRGEYNAGVTECLRCSYDYGAEMFQNTIGITHTDRGRFVMIECPECFKINRFHLDRTYAHMLHMTIEDDENKFWDKDFNRRQKCKQ